MTVRRALWALIAMAALVHVAPVPATATPPLPAPPAQDELSREHREWLEMVTYIIEKEERRVFESLPTGWQRERFIEAFWQRRDPVPVTPENEYRLEYRRRWEYVNDVFGRDTPVPGWRTDRGRVYLTNGPPFRVHPYPNTQELWPLEVWEYRDTPRPGMPSFYQIIFFKPRVFSAWRLYSPSVDGPRSLLIASPADLDNINLQAIASRFPIVFEAALQAAPGLGALGSEPLIARTMAPPPPPRPLSLFYSPSGDAEAAFLGGGALKFGLQAVALSHPELEGYVDVTLELPAEMTRFVQVDERMIANYEVEFEIQTAATGAWRESGGAMVVSVPVEEQDLVQEVPIQYSRRLWLLPGTYELRVLLTEVATHRVGVAEARVNVPEPTDLVFGAPELFYVTERRRGTDAATISTQPVPWVNNTFRRGYAVGCRVRVVQPKLGNDAPATPPPDLELEYRLSQHGLTVWRDRWLGGDTTTTPGESLGIVRTLHIEELPSGSYELEVLAHRGSGGAATTVSLGSRPIELVDEYMPVARLLPAESQETDLAAGHHRVGQQRLRRNDFVGARAHFERAVRLEPRNAIYQIDAAKTLLLAGELAVAEDLLASAVGQDPGNQEAFATLGLLRLQQANFAAAIDAYRRALDLAPGTPAIYNGLAEAYLSTGNPARALEMLDLSLDINGAQEQVRALRDRLQRERTPDSDPRPR